MTRGRHRCQSIFNALAPWASGPASQTRSAARNPVSPFFMQYGGRFAGAGCVVNAHSMGGVVIPFPRAACAPTPRARHTVSPCRKQRAPQSRRASSVWRWRTPCHAPAPSPSRAPRPRSCCAFAAHLWRRPVLNDPVAPRALPARAARPPSASRPCTKNTRHNASGGQKHTSQRVGWATPTNPVRRKYASSKDPTARRPAIPRPPHSPGTASRP